MASVDCSDPFEKGCYLRANSILALVQRYRHSCPAVELVFSTCVARKDKGKSQPNYSSLGGDLASSSLAKPLLSLIQSAVTHSRVSCGFS
jgi:hypothetical protein